MSEDKAQNVQDKVNGDRVVGGNIEPLSKGSMSFPTIVIALLVFGASVFSPMGQSITNRMLSFISDVAGNHVMKRNISEREVDEN